MLTASLSDLSSIYQDWIAPKLKIEQEPGEND